MSSIQYFCWISECWVLLLVESLKQRYDSSSRQRFKDVFLVVFFASHFVSVCSWSYSLALLMSQTSYQLKYFTTSALLPILPPGPILPVCSSMHDCYCRRTTRCPGSCVTFQHCDCCLRLFSQQQRFSGSKMDPSFIPVALMWIFFSELLSVLIIWSVVGITFVALRLIPFMAKHIKKTPIHRIATRHG